MAYYEDTNVDGNFRRQIRYIPELDKSQDIHSAYDDITSYDTIYNPAPKQEDDIPPTNK